MHEDKLNKKVKELINDFDKYIQRFDKDRYRGGPSLYFYEETMKMLRKETVSDVIEDSHFIEFMYATMAAWDMNTRGAEMVYFKKFKENIQKNKDLFVELSHERLDNMSESEFDGVCEKLRLLFNNLEVMETTFRVISNSKIMHLLVPDLVMPMDAGTRKFFGVQQEDPKKLGQPAKVFLRVFRASWLTARSGLNFAKYATKDNVGWHQSIPKIIDNAIIGRSRLIKDKTGQVKKK